MKLTIERSKLLKALTHIQSVVETRNTIPILANVLLRAEAGTLHLTATDLNVEIIEKVEARVDIPGAITINARMLHDIVRKMPDGSQVEMAMGEKNMNVVAGRARFSIVSLDAKDFPVVPTEDLVNNFAISADVLSKAIAKARFAISTEETRYYLNGIFISIVNNEFKLVATDGHRMAVVTVPTPAGIGKLPDIIVPRKCVGELVKLLDDVEGDIDVSLNGSKIKFALGDVVLTSKLIDGTFPDWTRVVPANNKNIVVTDAAGLRGAIDRVSAVASEKTRAVKMEVGNNKITLTVTSPENGSASDDVPATNVDEVTIGFNARYLIDAISQMDTDNVEFHLGGSDAPALIREEGKDDYFVILMPMRV